MEDVNYEALKKRHAALLLDDTRAAKENLRLREENERLRKLDDLELRAELKDELWNERVRGEAEALQAERAKLQSNYAAACKRAEAWEREAKRLHGVLNNARHMLKHNADVQKVRSAVWKGLDEAVKRYKELKRTISFRRP